MISLMLALFSSNVQIADVTKINIPTVSFLQDRQNAAPEAELVRPASLDVRLPVQDNLVAVRGGPVPMGIQECPDLAVPMQIMKHVVNVESGRNPYAIGVVGGHLVRQPRNLQEAVATADMLKANGYNYSVGISQVNRYNFARYGLNSHQQAFDTCSNLKAGTRILRECYDRSGGDWAKSFSCYYSGNFVTGFKHGYVQKVLASLKGASVAAIPVNESPNAIAVVSTSARAEVRRNSRLAAAPSVQYQPATQYQYEAPVAVKAIETVAPAQAQVRNEPVRPVDEAFVF